MTTEIHASQVEWIDSERFEQLYPYKRRTFFLWIADGRLTAYKPSKRKTLVKRQDVERLLEASRTENNLDKVVDETMRDLRASK